MSSNVWVVRRSIHDISPAEEHGVLCTVYPSSLSPHNVEEQLRIIRDEVFSVASAGDFVLTAGPSLMVAVFAGAWLARFKTARLLTYNRGSNRFVEKMIRLGDDMLRYNNDLR